MSNTAYNVKKELALLQKENESLRNQLEEAKETLDAIREGAVDALVVDTPAGERIFTLEGAESSYRAMIEQMGEGAVTLTADGRIQYCNRGFAEMLQRPLEQVIGSSMERYLAEADRTGFETLLRQSAQGNGRGEFRFVAKDDSVIPTQVGLFPLKDCGDAASVSMVVTNLSERKQAERVVASEEMHRVFFELAAVGMAYISPEGRIVKANEEYAEITGYAREDLIGMPVLDLTHPDDRESERQVFDLYLRGQTPVYTAEKRYLRKDGAVRWVNVTARIVHDADGSPRYSIGIVEDVTSRKQAEAALLQSEQLARVRAAEVAALLDAAPTPVFIAHDALATHITGNRAADEFLRNPSGAEASLSASDDAKPRHFKAFKDGRELRNDELPAQRAARGEEVRDFEFNLVFGDGTTRNVLGYGTPLWDDRGQSRGAVHVLVDITERKRAEEELRAAHQRLRYHMQNSPLAVVEFDADLRVVAWSDAAQRTFGWEASEILGKCMWDMPWVFEEDREQVRAVSGAMVNGSAQRTVSPNRNLRKDGSVVWCEWYSSSLTDASGKMQSILSLVLDVTERQVAMEAAKRARAEAEAASKAKDQFIAVLSHELRNPLNPVLATAKMLRDDPRWDADTREQLDVIYRNAELEARLIDDLLDVTRIERGKMELNFRPVELCAVLKQAWEVCKPEIEARKQRFVIESECCPCFVNADVTRLQQVFWNLIKNAVKFTPTGGSIKVRCHIERPPGLPHAQVVVEVQDSGEGIETEFLSRIFNAFDQGPTRRMFGGLGLGLTISKAMVEYHGGSIEAHSEGKGKGATFTVRLPIMESATLIEKRDGRDGYKATARDTRKLAILLVEDHADTARIMRRVLSAEGHTVEIALNVAGALLLTESRKFDLLLSDLGLPDGSGLDLLRQLRSRGHTVPAIALSGYGQEHDLQQSAEAGFAAHLVKPVDLKRLSTAIATAIGA